MGFPKIGNPVNKLKDAAKNGGGKIKDAGGKAKDAGKGGLGILDKVKDKAQSGSGLFSSKLKDIGGNLKGGGNLLKDKWRDGGGNIKDKLQDAGGNLKDKAQEGGSLAQDKLQDVAELSREGLQSVGQDALAVASNPWISPAGPLLSTLQGKSPLEAYADGAKQLFQGGKDFAGGLEHYARDEVGTIKNIALNPLDTLKGLGELASNPWLSPVGLPTSLVRSALERKNPLDYYADGAEQLKDLGGNLVADYQEVYAEHGLAGLAGYLAPEIALTILSGGGTAGGKASAGLVAREIAKNLATEPFGKINIADAARQTREDRMRGEDDGPSAGWLQGLADNFSW